MGKKLEASLAVLNGAIGDYLSRTGNGLATEMAVLAHVGDEAPLALDPAALAKALPAPARKLAVFAHGLMVTEAIWEMPDRTDYGSRLAADLGYTPLYLRYNSGLAIADNGARLSRVLDTLVAAYPGGIEEIVPVGYSMGGLVVRSACHVARLQGSAWLPLVRRAIYIGTPHLGSPFERAGRVVAKVLRAIDDPYTQLVGQIADLRSSGLKDLGNADLRHEDRSGPRLRDAQHPVPLLPDIQHYLIAGSLSTDPWLAALFGDAVVPMGSATAGLVDATKDVLPPGHVKLFHGLSHLMLSRDLQVYEAVRGWCADNPAENRR
ncbi:MAG TPA: alpha/beta hydrolase [Polyangiaceae bacterium]|nr:alpha/beta hydrolase [Polyangiaceae bacterium]